MSRVREAMVPIAGPGMSNQDFLGNMVDQSASLKGRMERYQ